MLLAPQIKYQYQQMQPVEFTLYRFPQQLQQIKQMSVLCLLTELKLIQLAQQLIKF
jgi:hypothetical protein